MNCIELDLLEVTLLSIQVRLDGLVNCLLASKGIREQLDQGFIRGHALLTLVLLDDLVELGVGITGHVSTHPVKCQLAALTVHALEEVSFSL